jgi:hypothetical protein
MKLGELCAPQPGTYVWLELTNSSKELLRAWALEQGVESNINFNKLHVTVLYSRQTVPVLHEVRDHFAVPTTFKTLDKKAFVLQLDAPTIVERHQMLRGIGATHDWDDYIPHMTLWVDRPPLELEPPTFGLVFTNEQSEPLKL